MSYSFYSDVELRNLLFVNPSNAAAVAEATRRFCHPRITDENLQKVRDVIEGAEAYFEEMEETCCIDVPLDCAVDWIGSLREALHVD